MRTCNNRFDFEKTLAKQGISAIFRTNNEGRIYGATFIDHEQKCVFNGSRLGKEFSANVFNDVFSGREYASKQPDKTFEPFQKIDKEYVENSNSGGIFDFPASDNTSDDIAEQDLVRRFKKKKKHQRGV
jgi:hypothetical protein